MGPGRLAGRNHERRGPGFSNFFRSYSRPSSSDVDKYGPKGNQPCEYVGAAGTR
jgi:hypothetical protein